MRDPAHPGFETERRKGGKTRGPDRSPRVVRGSPHEGREKASPKERRNEQGPFETEVEPEHKAFPTSGLKGRKEGPVVDRHTPPESRARARAPGRETGGSCAVLDRPSHSVASTADGTTEPSTCTNNVHDLEREFDLPPSDTPSKSHVPPRIVRGKDRHVLVGDWRSSRGSGRGWKKGRNPRREQQHVSSRHVEPRKHATKKACACACAFQGAWARRWNARRRTRRTRRRS